MAGLLTGSVVDVVGCGVELLGEGGDEFALAAGRAGQAPQAGE
jgi:hypothetical protein